MMVMDIVKSCMPSSLSSLSIISPFTPKPVFLLSHLTCSRLAVLHCPMYTRVMLMFSSSDWLAAGRMKHCLAQVCCWFKSSSLPSSVSVSSPSSPSLSNFSGSTLISWVSVWASECALWITQEAASSLLPALKCSLFVSSIFQEGWNVPTKDWLAAEDLTKSSPSVTQAGSERERRSEFELKTQTHDSVHYKPGLKYF